jgi:tRNA 5-methylaminomethyl-2-thiouridine biosynthesis bifunctional protein
VSRDRLPLIGQVPCQLDGSRVSGHPQASRADTPRRVERQDGLYVFTALGSRGITWAALGGRIIAASISGSPLPVGSRLLDAIDPARFTVRERQRPER